MAQGLLAGKRFLIAGVASKLSMHLVLLKPYTVKARNSHLLIQMKN